MLKKRMVSILIVTLLLLSLNSCKPLELARYFGLLRPNYTYEGYVVDYITKKPVSNAEFFLLEQELYANQKGYFKFKAPGSWEDWRLTHQHVKKIKAEGYGTLFSWIIDVNVVNIIPLAPPGSAYGRLIFEGDRKFKLVVVGTDSGYTAETFTNDDGEFCFRDLPLSEKFNLIIYEGDKKYSQTVGFIVDKFYNEYIKIEDELKE